MKFLKAVVEAEEILKLARSGFKNNNRKVGYHDKVRVEGRDKFRKLANIPTASNFITTKEHLYKFCGKNLDRKILMKPLY